MSVAPGPLAIQGGIYISYLRTGFWGAWAGGWAFIFPNFVIVAALGALFVHLGDLPAVTTVFYGASPAAFNVIVAPGGPYTDVDVSVRFKPISGSEDASRGQSSRIPVVVYPDQDADEIGCLIVPNAAVLIAGSPHQDEGKKLIDYLLSKETESAAAASVRRFSMGQDPTQSFRNDWIACSLVAIAA